MGQYYHLANEYKQWHVFPVFALASTKYLSTEWSKCDSAAACLYADGRQIWKKGQILVSAEKYIKYYTAAIAFVPNYK